MNHTAFFDLLKSGQIGECYLFEGAEEYIKQQALKQLCARILPAGLEEMNLTDLTDPDADSLIAAAETLPFMGEKRLVIIRECSLISAAKKSEDDRKVEAITEYLGRIPPSACLVFYVKGKADGRKKLYTLLKKKNAIVDFSPMNDAECADWARKVMRRMGKNPLRRCSWAAGVYRGARCGASAAGNGETGLLSGRAHRGYRCGHRRRLHPLHRMHGIPDGGRAGGGTE